MTTKGKVYLIPTVLQDDEQAFSALPAYILEAIKDCDAFFAENIKTTRRYFKRWWKEMVIDDYTWVAIHKAEQTTREQMKSLLMQGKNIGIISEAGCPGVADPGSLLVETAQQIGANIHPMVGPNAILLALMASGMNGQQFQFCGYLPIDKLQRRKEIQALENDSRKRSCTQIFIETPYRNNALLEDLTQICHPATKLCVAVDITSAKESIRTKDIQSWQKKRPDIHKRPAIFLILAS